MRWGVSLLLLLLTSPLYAQSNAINVMDAPYSASGDGVTDDTVAIQKALLTGSYVYFPSGYTFLTDGHTINTRKHLTCGDGTALKLRAENVTSGTSERILNFIAGSGGSSIEGCVLDGNRDNVKSKYTTGEWSCLSFNVPNLSFRGMEIKECTTVGIGAEAAGEKGHLFVDNLYIHDVGLGARLSEISDSNLNNIILDHIDNEGVSVFQHALDLRHSERVQINNLRMTNLGGDTHGHSAWSSGLTIIGGSAEINNLYLSDMIADDLFHMGVSILASSIVGSNWTILRYAGTSIELLSNPYFMLNNFIIDCEYKANSVQSGSWGITTGEGGYYRPTETSGHYKSGFHNQHTHLSNGIIKRCMHGIRQSAGNLFLSNVELQGMTKSGIYASDNYHSTSFVNSPKDTQLTTTVLADVVARYNGEAGVFLENANNVSITGGMYSNNGQNMDAPDSSRGGIVDAPGGSVGPIFVSGVRAEDTQKGILAANASIDWSTYGGPFIKGDLIEFLAIQSVDYHEGQRVGLLNICSGIKCDDVDGDGTKDDLITNIIDIDLDSIHGKITTEAGTIMEKFTTGIGTINTLKTVMTGNGSSFDEQFLGRSWIKASGEFRSVVKVTDSTNAVIDRAFPTDLVGVPFQISQVDVQLIPSQQYGFYLTQASSAQLVGNSVFGNTIGNSFVSGMKQFVTENWESPLIAERTGKNPAKFAVQVGGNSLGLLQKGAGKNAQWVSGARSGVGYTISNGPDFGTNDALTIEEKTLEAKFAGKIKSTAPDLGWTPRNVSNQACVTTCTMGACIAGINNTLPVAFLSCEDPASDSCLCTN